MLIYSSIFTHIHAFLDHLSSASQQFSVLYEPKRIPVMPMIISVATHPLALRHTRLRCIENKYSALCLPIRWSFPCYSIQHLLKFIKFCATLVGLSKFFQILSFSEPMPKHSTYSNKIRTYQDCFTMTRSKTFKDHIRSPMTTSSFCHRFVARLRSCDGNW